MESHPSTTDNEDDKKSIANGSSHDEPVGDGTVSTAEQGGPSMPSEGNRAAAAAMPDEDTAEKEDTAPLRKMTVALQDETKTQTLTRTESAPPSLDFPTQGRLAASRATEESAVAGSRVTGGKSMSAVPSATVENDKKVSPPLQSMNSSVVAESEQTRPHEMSNEAFEEFVNSPRGQSPIAAERSPGGRYIRFAEKLGSGASKDVYRAYDTQEGIEVAWNVVNLSGVPKAERNRIVNEVRLLERLHHQNIISFHGSWVNRERQEVNFVTEILSSGTLKSFIEKVQVIRWKIAKRWARQILKGLEYLHSQDPPVIHRDLKCENIFINGTSGDLRIGDLGLSTVHRNGQVLSVLGTPEFMAPDLYEESAYDEKVDIYAFGMCLLEIFTKEIPYSECNNPAQIYKKVMRGEPPQSLERIKSRHARDFIKLCLGRKGEDGKYLRPSANELLENKFLAKHANDEFEVELRPLLQERPIPELPPDDSVAAKSAQPTARTEELPLPRSRRQVPPNADDGSDKFDEMPDSEVNMKKVKVLIGRDQELEEDENASVHEVEDDEEEEEEIVTLQPASTVPTEQHGSLNGVKHHETTSGEKDQPNAASVHCVAAAVIEEEDPNVRPHADDILKLIITIPVDGQPQNVQFDFHLVTDDPVQVAKEMVEELGIPKDAVLEVGGTISALARQARMRQEQYNSLRQQRELQGQNVTIPVQQQAGVASVGPTSPTNPSKQDDRLISSQEPALPTHESPSNLDVPQVAPSQSVAGVLHQHTFPQGPAQSLPTQDSPNSTLGVPQPQAAAPSVQGIFQQPHSQIPGQPQQSLEVSNTMGVPIMMNGPAQVTLQAQAAPQQTQVPSQQYQGHPQLPTIFYSQPQQQSHLAMPSGQESAQVNGQGPVIQASMKPLNSPAVEGPEYAILPERTALASQDSLDSQLSDDEEENGNEDENDEVNEELRRLDEEFQKNMMRARKVFDNRMDNLHRTKKEREKRHQRTLEKHEKEQMEYEKRLRQEEKEQNRRMEELKKEWDRKRDQMQKKSQGKKPPTSLPNSPAHRIPPPPAIQHLSQRPQSGQMLAQRSLSSSPQDSELHKMPMGSLSRNSSNQAQMESVGVSERSTSSATECSQ